MRIPIRFRHCSLLLVPLIFGCRLDESKSPARVARADTAAAPAPAPHDDAPKKTVLFVGTSLTAALGLDPEQGYPARIQQKIDSAGLPFNVINAGVSGETAAGARRRIEGWLVRQPFDVMVLEMGANDMLRGGNVDSLRVNLQAIIDTVRASHPGAPIVLAGMLAAPNLGERYGARFSAVYHDLAARDSLPLVPFLLEGVAAHPDLNLGDGIHPNEQGYRIVANTLWPVLEPVLRRAAADPATDSAAP